MLGWLVLFQRRECAQPSIWALSLTTVTQDGSIPNQDSIDPVPFLCEPRVSPSPSPLSSIAKAPRGQNVRESIVDNTCRVLLLKAPDLIQNSTSIIALPLWPVLHYGWIKAQQISSEGFHLRNYIVVLRFFKQKRKIDWKRRGHVCLVNSASWRIWMYWMSNFLKISTSSSCSVCSWPFKLCHLEMMWTLKWFATE